MKVLHVAYNTYPDVTGGAIRTRYLVETQARLGIRPIVLSSPFQPPADPSLARGVEYCNGIPYHRCYRGADPARFMAAKKSLAERAARMLDLPGFTRQVWRIAREQRVDLIHAHSLSFCGLAAAAAGRALGIPVIYEVRSLIEEGMNRPGRIVSSCYRGLDALAFRAASHIVVLCEGLAREMVRRGVPQAGITVAGNGVDLDVHRPAAPRSGSPDFVAGYIGTLLPYEGLDLLIDAAARLLPRHPRFRVLLVGDGNARPGLERQVQALGLSHAVRFAGKVPHDQVARYYDDIDLFVLPRPPARISDLVTPLKPLEIMAHARPMLAGDCGGHRELLVDGVNGWLFAPHQADVLASRIEQCMADPGAGVRLGASARAWVGRNRSWESQTRPVVALYERLLAVRRKILLIAPLPGRIPSGGVEHGVGMILRSGLSRRYRLRVWRRSPAHVPFFPHLLDFLRFTLYLLRRRPSVVHIKTSSGANFVESVVFAVLSRMLFRRTLLQLHSGELESWYLSRSWSARWAIRRALRIPSELVALSGYWRDFLSSLAPGRPIHIVPNGVETAAFPAAAGGGNDPLHVLTIAARGESKGHREILRAAGHLRDHPIRFTLAGPGYATESPAANLAFTGPVGPRQKRALLSSADVFLLPSRAEGMPNAILEAMAAGLPVVATPVGAIPEMLPEGPLVPVGDSEAIARILIELLEDPARRREAGRRNRARVQAKYDFELVVRQLDRLYRPPCESAT